MPTVFLSVGKYLPFQYYWFYPTMVILDKSDVIKPLEGLAVLLLWIGIFASLAILLWRKGVKSFSAYGG